MPSDGVQLHCVHIPIPSHAPDASWPRQRCDYYCYFGYGLLQGSGPTQEEEIQEERYPSAVPFLPPLSASTVKYYYQFYAFAVGTIILFGGLLSPALEVNLGLGGTLPETLTDLCSLA